MKPFTEELRYEYPFHEESLVIDAGAHTGAFSREIGRRYNPTIIAYEPIRRFWEQAIQNQTDKTRVVPYGLGKESGIKIFQVKGDMSGEFAEGDEEKVMILDVGNLQCFKHIDLLKLNIEGGEYEVLERILELGMQNQIDNFQIQFHTNAPDYFYRRETIQIRLRATHHLTY